MAKHLDTTRPVNTVTLKLRQGRHVKRPAIRLIPRKAS